MSRIPIPNEATVKRRACDECRTRKLACSKDPDGCQRCRRENIACHYSEQKQMGRPRKRQHIESTIEDTITNQDLDPFNMSSIAEGGFEYSDEIAAEPYFTNGQSNFAFPTETSIPGHAVDDGRLVWNFGNGDVGGPPIDFGTVDNFIPPLDPPPQLATGSDTSVSSESSPPETNAGPPCSCLASMYLSLAALQKFPSNIVTALRTVRGACATASAAIYCPQCGTVILQSPNPPIESFQNIMLLGTILPTIANGYSRLLQMIDEETTSAESKGQTKTFAFQDYGGMCGRGITVTDTICANQVDFAKPVEMAPQQWRTTVRALLRVDIYGHEQPGFKHKGLKDLVAEMENRQKTRHSMVEAHVAVHGIDSLELGTFGGVKSLPGHGHITCSREEEPIHGCLQIIKIAKVAIDNLIIA